MLLLLGAGAAHAGSWTDLWWTHDQQGQKLLAENQPAQAAKVFDDSRRRGYAQLEAGHYAEAAKDLQPYKDADSQYNRGNALAHTGRLKEALDAYDAALAAAPGNRDVIKNRDLVKQALEKQRRTGQPQKPNGSGAKSTDKQGGGKDAGGKADAKQDGGTGGSGSEQSAAQQRGSGESGSSNAGDGGGDSRRGNAEDGSTQASQARNNQQPGAAGKSAQQGQSAAKAAAAAQAADRGNRSAAQAPEPAQGKAVGSNNPAADPHSQTSLADPATGRAGPTSDSNRDAIRNEVTSSLQKQHTNASTNAARQQPPSEQALALDQWLRTIPDDSGELLQRKFMIEHLMKQRGNEP